MFNFHVSTTIIMLTDYDECAQGENDCNENADCIDNEGDYSCECRKGYVGDGQTCNRKFVCIIARL